MSYVEKANGTCSGKVKSVASAWISVTWSPASWKRARARASIAFEMSKPMI